MENKFKADTKNFNFPTQSCLGSISNGFGATVTGKYHLKDICRIFPLMLLINLAFKARGRYRVSQVSRNN